MKIVNHNEIDLIRQTVRGDTKAFDPLVKKYRQTIYSLILSYVTSPADADDLTQVVFIKAYQRIGTLKKPQCFSGWLHQIAHNDSKNWLRQHAKSSTHLDDVDLQTPSPEKIALQAELQTTVRHAIDSLCETDRGLLESRYLDGASYEQLQVKSGLSYAAIANRIKRAKQYVRQRTRKLLSGFAIFPSQKVFGKLILSRSEIMKVSMKTKLVTAGIATLVALGSSGVWDWHTTQREFDTVNLDNNPSWVNTSQAQSVEADRGRISAKHETPKPVKPGTPVEHRTEVKANEWKIVDGNGKVAAAFVTVVGKKSIPEELFQQLPQDIWQKISAESGGKVLTSTVGFNGSGGDGSLTSEFSFELPVEGMATIEIIAYELEKHGIMDVAGVN